MKTLLMFVFAMFFLLPTTTFKSIDDIDYQDQDMDALQTAMIYNIMKYVNWPEDATSGDFNIGIYGNSEIYKKMMVYNDKPHGARKTKIKEIKNLDEIIANNDYKVIYISNNKSRDFDNIYTANYGKEVLLITFSQNLANHGSHVNLRIIDDKLKIELNQASIAASKLKVSSQLTSIAILK